ncbi:MAG: C25 family cysteine peptidase [Bacteroidota bacterium]
MRKVACLLIGLLICTISAFSANQKTINLNTSSTDELQILERSDVSLKLKSSISGIIAAEVLSEEYGFFTELVVKNYGANYSAIGKPHLPVLTRLIEIPYGANIKVNILSYDEEIIDLNSLGVVNKVRPAQPSISKSADPADIIFQYDQAAYLIDDFNQDDMVKVDFKGTMRGVNFGRVTISPFRYNPVQNTLIVYNNVEFEIVFENADVLLTQQMKDRYYSPYFEAPFRQMINYLPSASKDLITTYPITYIIVSDRMFEPTLQPFIQWKTRKGFKVIVGYTDVIGTSTTAIKNYIQNLYNTETPTPTFVLLVGDYAQITSFSGTTGSHVSDVYYCCYDGGGDYIPEMYIGRWPVQSTTECQSVRDKIMMHEQYTWPDDAFLDKCLLVAGVDASFAPTHGNGQICYGINEYFNTSHGYATIYAYYYNNTTWPYAVLASNNSGASNDIISKVSAGLGFANYTAHCSEDGWADPNFARSDISGLANANEYPVMIGNCCLSNRFNYEDAFGEMILYAANKGASAYLGGSNSTLWDEDFYWSVGVNSLSITSANAQNHNFSNTGQGAYDGVWHTHGEAESNWYITTAEMNYCGNLAVEASSSGNNDYYWEIYHVMGDPSMMAYLSIPSPLTVSYTDPIVVGTTTLVVNTEQYAYVAISQNNILLDAEYSGSSTSVTLTFPAFASPGTADVVVTKQFRQPYIGTVDIINIASNNDAALYSIDVPADVYDCPQTITPTVTIRNMGSLNLTSCNVSYILDGGSPVTVPWTGNLMQYTTAVVTFPSISLTQGNHTFQAYTSLPNGVADEYTANDSQNKNFTVNNVTPSAAFTADATIFCAAPVTVTFTNNSTNATSYLWDFGDGNTSTDENPVHTYTANGTYTVTLTADNGVCGNDVLVMTGYISIDPGNPCEYTVPTTGTVTEYACSGTLFDSGGDAAQYGDDENGIFIITPAGATSITLNFVSFDVEPGTSGQCNYDYLDIHDGNSTAATLIGKYCNNNIPTTITTTGGAVTLHFYSDGSVTHDGFEMTWNCYVPTIPPVAAFTSDVTSTCSGTVQFTDNSTNGPTSWLWDFGDGNTSTSQNPSYTYTANGTYTVSLTATNTYGSDQDVQTNLITVNMPAAPSATDVSRCDVGSVTLTATGASGDIEWYDAATGGNLVYTGSPFPTPSLSTTTTYYVQDHITTLGASQYGARTDNTGTGAYFTSAYVHGEIFDAYVPFKLVSVKVYAQTAGNRTITLQNSGGTDLQTVTVNIPTGESRITLDMDVPAGTDLKLLGPLSPGLFRNSAGTTYPYTLAGVFSVTTSTAGTTPENYYYYFYDWEVQTITDCSSPRTEVDAIIEQPLNVDISIVADANSICTGDNVTFTATPVNGGSSPSYQWQLNGSNVGTGGITWSSTTLNDGDMVTCILTSSEACVDGPATSNAITMSVASSQPVTASIASDLGTSICSGESVTFTITAGGQGTSPTYEWQLNGSTVGTSSPTYTTSGLSDNDQVQCIVTSSLSCATGNPASSNILTMTVATSVTPTIVITASETSICAGESVTFTANVSGEGSAPTYNWMINSVSVGSGTTFTTTTLTQGDMVTCELTSSETCAVPSSLISNMISMTVSPSLPVSVSISSDLGITICDGNLVTFTATPVNGGSTPTYLWLLNGFVAGNGSTYSSSTLSSGDEIVCVLTSSETCSSNNPDTSAALVMTVNDVPVAGYYYITSLLTVTFTDNSTGAASYLWDFGDGNTSTDQNPVYTYAADGTYHVVLTVTNNCGSDTVAYDITVIGTEITAGTTPDEIEVFPNPTTGSLNINLHSNKVSRIEFFDVVGKLIMTRTSVADRMKLDLRNLNQGVYYMKIYLDDEFITKQIIISR